MLKKLVRIKKFPRLDSQLFWVRSRYRNLQDNPRIETLLTLGSPVSSPLSTQGDYLQNG